jgi:hypothetical protein
MTTRFLRTASLGSLAAASAVLAGCSGGGGGGSGSAFEITSISVPEGATWKINKRIEVGFSDEVNLQTVIAGSTIQLTSTGGSGASAFYAVGYKTDLGTGAVDKTRLVIQPFCPLEDDLSDAGLLPGGVPYKLFFPKGGGGAASIRSIDGAPLGTEQARNFITPTSIQPDIVFEDPTVGAPAFVPALSFVRLGDGQEIPFVDAGTTFELATELPLNLYSDVASQPEFLIQLNQPVSPSDENLSQDRVRIEYLDDDSGSFVPFQTEVELEANCVLDAPGAILRLTPVGILPQASQVRVTLAAGFADLILQQVQSDQSNFFADTTTLDFTSLTPANGGADEVYEDFLVGGPAGLQDVDATLGTPAAVWAGGELTAAFDFEGTGGPGGTFDWHVPGLFNFSTDLQAITGGVDGEVEQTIQCVGGVVDVNDLVVPSTALLRIQPGPNPMTIFATGDVIIEGTIDVSGFNAKPTFTLLTPALPEVGAAGCAGGGTGGTGSFLTSASTLTGGIGFGPFGQENAGGRGGEASFLFSPAASADEQRAAGGGGGRFAPNADLDGVPGGYSDVATAGEDGHPKAIGAITGAAPPKGGLPNPGPFLDASSENDFFGQKGVFDGSGQLLDVIPGELGLRWAGYGGGAGGDSIKGLGPTSPFPGSPVVDRKGAGGGGGAGQLRIVALGKIVFRSGGRILARGGQGARGESVVGEFYIGGSSGGGSGGHVILESATQIDFSDEGAIVDPSAEPFVQTFGGEGGLGDEKEIWSEGGEGGLGVIQLHVPDANPATAIGSDPLSPIRMPLLAGTDLSKVTKPAGIVLLPTFGARSKARTKWIPLGAADLPPGGGPPDPLLFAFGGTDPVGDVVTTASVVDPLAPILGPEVLGTAAPDPFVDSDGYTLVLSPASIAPLINDVGMPSLDIYLRTPSLLTNFQLHLEGPSTAADFDVASATYADAGMVLRITTDPAAASPQSFVAGAGGPVSYELIPRFFRAQTGLLNDVIPETGYVRVLFQATSAGPDGQPIEDTPLVDWTPDISEFNAVTPGTLDFFRWEVEFNLDAAGAGLTTETTPFSLHFLRTPFSF